MATASTDRRFKIVAAIDIGTPFSGYAFSTTETFRKEPLNIAHKKHWHASSKTKNLVEKTVTCLLLDKNKDFVSFGNTAQSRYAELKCKKKDGDYLFFRHFYLQLYECKVPMIKVELADVDGKGHVSAKNVFAMSIEALKQEVLQQFETSDRLVNESEIFWVLTIPVALPEDSKFFITQCAKQAHINGEQLLVVTEPEAAFVYCQYCENIPRSIRTVEEFVYIKIAGKTTEVALVKKETSGNFQIRLPKKDVHGTSQYGICNDLVDADFLSVLISILGAPLLEKIHKSHPDTTMKLIRNFNKIKLSDITRCMVPFPCKLFNASLLESHGESLEEALNVSQYKDKIQVRMEDEYLILTKDLIQSCFATTAENLSRLLKESLNTFSSTNIKNVIIVGDLAESSIIQKEVVSHFPTPSKTIIVPSEANLAVVKGAVLIGHTPDIIGVRYSSKKMSSSDYEAVVAIDFGTAYSGFAFSTKTRYEESPLKISIKKWKGGKEFKTNTSVLFDDCKRFKQFGSKAQDDYAKLQSAGKLESCIYFENFKMMLYKKQQQLRALLLNDIQDRPEKAILALDVFAAAIQSLKEDAIKELEKNGTHVFEDEIRWVITVPAIWPDNAKLFMRESAMQAGIASDKLLIALEPEVASIYAQWQETSKSAGVGFEIASPGTRYLVADVGGGTTDITVHEKLQNGKLKELNKASGEGCGGRSVDAEFFKLLDKIFGKDIMKRMKSEKPNLYIKIQRSFEDVKKEIGLESRKHSIKMPVGTMDSFLGGDRKTDELAKQFNEKFEIIDGSLFLPYFTFVGLFTPTIDAIISNIQNALQQSDNVSLIMLVGGFAKSKLLQHRIKNEFHTKRVIIPEDANVAVLKGAVLYGHKPESIDPRVTRFTYGVETLAPFLHGIHDPGKLFIDGRGRSFCKQAFGIIIKENETVALGERIKRTYKIPPFTTEINIQFYCSKQKIPLYTDDCKKIGTLMVTIPKPSEEKREVDVVFIFGNTEIKVEATESSYKKEATAQLSFE